MESSLVALWVHWKLLDMSCLPLIGTPFSGERAAAVWGTPCFVIFDLFCRGGNWRCSALWPCALSQRLCNQHTLWRLGIGTWSSCDALSPSSLGFDIEFSGILKFSYLTPVPYAAFSKDWCSPLSLCLWSIQGTKVSYSTFEQESHTQNQYWNPGIVSQASQICSHDIRALQIFPWKKNSAHKSIVYDPAFSRRLTGVNVRRKFWWTWASGGAHCLCHVWLASMVQGARLTAIR